MPVSVLPLGGRSYSPCVIARTTKLYKQYPDFIHKNRHITQVYSGLVKVEGAFCLRRDWLCRSAHGDISKIQNHQCRTKIRSLSVAWRSVYAGKKPANKSGITVMAGSDVWRTSIPTIQTSNKGASLPWAMNLRVVACAARCASWPRGQPDAVMWCHCQSCRKHSGAPVSVFAAFRREAYVVTKGEITQIQFVARPVARILCQVRLNADLRRRAFAGPNAFPYWSLRSSRAT